MDMLWLPFFLPIILSRDYRKMTIHGHFPIIPLEKPPFISQSIPMDPKHSLINGLHCNKNKI